MKAYKNNPSLIVLAAVFFLVSFQACKTADLGPDAESIEQWILGTSVSIREDFSPESISFEIRIGEHE